jgi:hypothetical protein
LREVYYAGIEGLKLPWTLLDNPLEWFNCPVGAIIVLDECQNYFRPRAYGKDVPEAVSRFEVHRHHGHDVVLITQNPMLIDVNIRRVAGRHLHIVRAFGSHKAIVHEWGSVQSEPNHATAKAQALDSTFQYPKEDFALYKSAELHTVKRKVPMRIWFLFASPFVIVAAAGAAYWSFQRTADAAKVGKAAEVVKAEGAASGKPLGLFDRPGSSSSGEVKGPKTLAELVKERTPLLAGFPHTAPVYYELTRPKAVPMPAACIKSRSKGCRCFTQQATLIADLSQEQCSQIVDRGYFMDFDPRGIPGAEGLQGTEGAGKSVERGLPQAVGVPVVREGAAASSGQGGGLEGAAVPDERGYAGAGGATRGPLLPPSALKKF